MIRDLQRIQIKILSDAPAGLNLDPFLKIFGRWRTEKEHPAEWVDLADYAHVPRGPGIVLIGQRCNLAFDLADPAPGIFYAAKKRLTGSHLERILAAMKSCLELSKRLVEEEEFPQGLNLRTDSFELRFSDRLETPNTAATDQELRPAVQQVFNLLYGECGYELHLQPDPQECFGFWVRARNAHSLDGLLERVSEAFPK